jgi:Radical SAM superfamily
MASVGGGEEPHDSLLGVSLDATSICNLRCTTCALEDSYPNPGVMSLKTFHRLDDALPRLKHLAFSSSAEPLLNPHIVAMVRHAKNASGGKITTSFTTNATFLDERMTRDLYRAGLDALEVSLDAATKETFERIRVRADFDLILGNLKRGVGRKRPRSFCSFVCRRADKYFGVVLPDLGPPPHQPHISVRYTVFADNVRELVPFVRMMHDMGIEHVVVNGLEPYTPEMSKKVLFGKEAPPEMLALFEELEALSQEFGMRLDLPRLVPDSIDDCNLIDHSCMTGRLCLAHPWRTRGRITGSENVTSTTG